MSVFRPARKVTTPTGDYWELYVSKTRLPSLDGGREGMHEDGGVLAPMFLPFALVLGLLEALWWGILVPLARVLVLLPVAWVRGRRSRAVRIEAVNPYPPGEVLLWTTTEGQVSGVLDEIAAGLAEGRIVQPAGAVYSGLQ
jgi:hypothetical protein